MEELAVLFDDFRALELSVGWLRCQARAPVLPATSAGLQPLQELCAARRRALVWWGALVILATLALSAVLVFAMTRISADTSPPPECPVVVDTTATAGKLTVKIVARCHEKNYTLSVVTVNSPWSRDKAPKATTYILYAIAVIAIAVACGVCIHIAATLSSLTSGYASIAARCVAAHHA